MNAEERIAVAILRIRHRQPFFGVLALFAEHRLDPAVQTAATDGKVVVFNPEFAQSLSDSELDAVMVHELLHAALLHCPRRGERDGYLWNLAADIVVNGIIRQEPSLVLPAGACMDPDLEGYEVEEVYEIIRDRKKKPKNVWIGPDLFPAGRPLENDQTAAAGARIPADLTEQEAYWKQAWQQATLLVEASGKGTLPAGLKLSIEALTAPQLDWRSLMWRFLVRTPVDFSGFDRRLVGRGLYLEALEGESISVRIAVDTSGSVDAGILTRFLSEVNEIVRLYPHLNAELFYADTSLYGPFGLSEALVEAPRGGGGTFFAPFFEHVAKSVEPGETTLLIYLTDGRGSFPRRTPEQPVLWVVTPGGLPSPDFPFGEVARLRD
jgi:predicted metal-dependent peptidase